MHEHLKTPTIRQHVLNSFLVSCKLLQKPSILLTENGEC